jgi:hypothetical protein
VLEPQAIQNPNYSFQSQQGFIQQPQVNQISNILQLQPRSFSDISLNQSQENSS